MTLTTLYAEQVRSTDGDESRANTAKSDLLAETGSEEEHASGRDEEIAAALRALETCHPTLLLFRGVSAGNQTGSRSGPGLDELPATIAAAPVTRRIVPAPNRPTGLAGSATTG